MDIMSFCIAGTGQAVRCGAQCCCCSCSCSQLRYARCALKLVKRSYPCFLRVIAEDFEKRHIWVGFSNALKLTCEHLHWSERHSHVERYGAKGTAPLSAHAVVHQGAADIHLARTAGVSLAHQDDQIRSVAGKLVLELLRRADLYGKQADCRLSLTDICSVSRSQTGLL